MSFEATPFPRLGNVIAPAENPGFPAFIGSRRFRLRGRQRQIRGVPGDEAPWEIAKAIGRLDSEGI